MSDTLIGAPEPVVPEHLPLTPLAVVEWDCDSRIRRWAGQAEAMFGWTESEMLGHSIPESNFIHGDDAVRVAGVVADLLRHTVSGNVCRNRNNHKSGRTVHCVWYNSAYLDADGRVSSVVSLAQDLTEQYAIEAELTLSEERLRSALRLAGMLSWDYDDRTASITYSQDVRTFFNTPDLAPGADLDYGIAHPDDRPRLREEVLAAKAALADFRIEYRGARPETAGRPQWFSTRGSFVTDAGGDIVRTLGITVNITERKQFERQREALDHELREARHLESLGMLAGGIAHDFNNLLTIILGNVDLVALQTGMDGPVGKSLSEIDAACQRAADLCSQIAAYAGVGRLQATEFDFRDVLRESEPAFRVIIGPRAVLTFDLESRPCPASGELRQIRQALGNVLLNASEAFGELGGDIRILTERIALDGTLDGFQPAVAAGEYLAIRIRDTGAGMPEAVRARAFEAFYSTKFAGRGLGLAAVYGIVRSHRGAVRIRSRPGAGTTVELLFPMSADRNAPAPVAKAPHPNPHRRILVVDDDANIRELICSLLEEHGHAVVAAENGLDASELFESNPSGFQLAVVDMMMPGMKGDDLIRRLRRTIPGFPVVVVSGYADREMPADIAQTGPTLVVPKPFRLEQLSGTVARLISAAPPA